MSARARRTLAILALLAWPGISCSETTTSPEPAAREESEARTEGRADQDNVMLELQLVDDDGAERRSFAASTAIHLRLTLRNPTEREVALAFSSGRTHDAVVLGPDGSERWRWSNGRRFSQALSELQLAPGEESSFELECNPSDVGGGALPSGRYQATGVIPVLGAELRSTTIEFEIE